MYMPISWNQPERKLHSKAARTIGDIKPHMQGEKEG
jgi:hypothetical protein